MRAKKVYVDYHIIQTVPPSCVNRDDTGSPKTAIYGGVQRSRVSSQSWKRAIRKMFSDSFNEAELGVRTKRIVEIVKEAILNINSSVSEEKAQSLAEDAVENAGVSLKDGEAKALFFLSNKQAENLASFALDQSIEDKNRKKAAQLALRKDTGVDVALFGRMVADDPSLNTDATCQVAHAISTHRVENEYDFFTAVDDKAPEDNAGAGMIGTVEYNSSTLYRYATIATHELYTLLADSREAAAKAIKEFTHAFITSMPTGKQNTFANRTLPDTVVVTIRDDQPINMVGAFEQPIRADKEAGYVTKSITQLFEYMETVDSDYYGTPLKTWIIGAKAPSLGDTVTMPELLAELEDEISAILAESQASENEQ